MQYCSCHHNYAHIDLIEYLGWWVKNPFQMQVQFYDSDLNKGSIRFHRTWFDFIILYIGFFQDNQQWFWCEQYTCLVKILKQTAWILGVVEMIALLSISWPEIWNSMYNHLWILAICFGSLVKQMFTYLDYLCIIFIWHVFRTGKKDRSLRRQNFMHRYSIHIREIKHIEASDHTIFWYFFSFSKPRLIETEKTSLEVNNSYMKI